MLSTNTGIGVGYLKKCEGCRRTYLKEMQMLNFEKNDKSIARPWKTHGKLMDQCCAMLRYACWRFFGDKVCHSN